MADDELWHVRISADEVKTLTLEQIDDLFRLDVIDADTQLWQDGMDEWLPLRVVAGLDEEEVVNISVPPSIPPKVNNTMSWPPPAVVGPSPTNSSWPPPAVSRSAAPSARSVPPAPPSSRPNPAAFASTVPTWPPGAAQTKSAAPAALFSPSYAPPASIRPQVVAEPYKYPRPTNPVPIVLAAIVGIVITLYRNEVLYAGARTVGQEAAYLQLEQALGGPGFGTPRAVEPMAKAAAALAEITPLPAPTSTSKSNASGASDSSQSSLATKATAKPLPPTQLSELKKVAAPAPQPQSAPRPVARPEPDAPNAVFKQPKGAKKAKGNEFDPLNPNL